MGDTFAEIAASGLLVAALAVAALAGLASFFARRLTAVAATAEGTTTR